MKDFGKIEKALAELLSGNPRLKNLIKRGYKFINFILFSKGLKIDTLFQINEVEHFKYGSFFGYYDKSPINTTSEFILLHRPAYNSSLKPKVDIPVEIILKDVKEGCDYLIDKTTTYNWQQGSRLQWLSNDLFIFNYYDESNKFFGSKIYSAENKQKQATFHLPVYDCHKDQFALTLNFTRMALLRPDYGYSNLLHNKIELDDRNDGIYFLDLKSGLSNLIISFEKLAEIKPCKTMLNARHKVNHIMISPDGQKFIFIHRWFIKGGKRLDRLLVSDIKGSNIEIISDNEMVSHCCWVGNENVVGFLKNESFGNKFYKIDMRNGHISLISNQFIQFGDGHPSVMEGKMVFDSYPDRAGMKHLYLYDFDKDSIKEIGKFLEPIKFYGVTRCDLHPRWSPDGSRIYIDSTHSGVRKLYSLSILS